MAFTSSASESSNGGGSTGGGMFGNVGALFAKALGQAQAQNSKATSEEAPGNAINKKKGGSVKGWGKARGARAAKYY